MVHVLVAGHANWDVRFRVDRLPQPDGESRLRSERRGGGGSAANAAVTFASLDVEVGILAAVGDDGPGATIAAELEAAGVDTTRLAVRDGATTVKYVLVDDDGEVATIGTGGVNEAFDPATVPGETLAAVDGVHLTGQEPAAAAELARRAAAAGCTVSVDPGRRLADRDVSPVLAHADVVLVNRPEARTLLKGPYEESAFADRTVVEKRGARGALAYTPDGERVHEGYPTAPVDTTGAGDAFAAGFLAATLDGESLEAALELGNACGAVAVEREGARCVVDDEALAAVRSRERTG